MAAFTTNRFCIKNNPRENRFFAASGRLADGKGTHNVKILAENYTKEQLCRKHARGQRLQGMQPTTHGDRIMEMQKQPAVGRQFSAYGKGIE